MGHMALAIFRFSSAGEKSAGLFSSILPLKVITTCVPQTLIVSISRESCFILFCRVFFVVWFVGYNTWSDFIFQCIA